MLDREDRTVVGAAEALRGTDEKRQVAVRRGAIARRVFGWRVPIFIFRPCRGGIPATAAARPCRQCCHCRGRALRSIPAFRGEPGCIAVAVGSDVRDQLAGPPAAGFRLCVEQRAAGGGNDGDGRKPAQQRPAKFPGAILPVEIAQTGIIGSSARFSPRSVLSIICSPADNSERMMAPDV